LIKNILRIEHDSFRNDIDGDFVEFSSPVRVGPPTLQEGDRNPPSTGKEINRCVVSEPLLDSSITTPEPQLEG